MLVVYRCNARPSINDTNVYAHILMLDRVAVPYQIQNVVVTKHKTCRNALYIYLKINKIELVVENFKISFKIEIIFKLGSSWCLGVEKP